MTLASRAAQGLPPKITDPAVLARVVALIHAQQGRNPVASCDAIDDESERGLGRAVQHRLAGTSVRDGDLPDRGRAEADREPT